MQLDDDWRYTFINQAAESIIGTEGESRLGRSIWEVFPEAVGSQFEATYQRARATGTPQAVELYFAPRKTWFEATAVPSALGLTITFRDVTGRKEAEAERAQLLLTLAAANNRLEIQQGVSDAALASLDLNTLLPQLLRRVREVMAVDNCAILLSDDASGMLRIRAVDGPEEIVATQVQVPIGNGFAGRIAASGQPLIVENVKTYDVVNPFLREHLTSLLGVPLCSNRRTLGVLHIGTVETRRFLPEDVALLQTVAERAALALDHATLFETLRTREAQLSTLFSTLPQLLWALDESSQVVYLNDHWYAYTGHQPADQSADHSDPAWRQAIHPDDEVVLMRTHQAALARQEGYELEVRFRRYDGIYRWHLYRALPVLDEHHQAHSWFGVATDIDDLKQASTALRELNETLEQRVADRTAALEAANRDLDAFSYTVAHDLRAPLRGMQGFAQVLVEDYGGELDAAALHYIQRIQHAAERMDTLIQDLLGYGRLGREYIPIGLVALDAVVRQARELLASELRATQAALHIDSPLADVLGNSELLLQVVTNLLSNAIKYRAPDAPPAIHIWTDRRDATGKVVATGYAALPGEVIRARLWIEDAGLGVAPEHLERIFLPFERLHGEESYPGSGIGLAIVRRSMERLHGHAGVESTLGAGSRFWIELPAA